MSKYIFGKIRKEDMYAKLISHNSKYSILYKESFPAKENAYNFWIETFDNTNNNNNITYEDSVAIVNWVYCTINDEDERIEFTQQIFKQIKDFNSIENNIKYDRGVFYNSKKVVVKFFSSVAGISKFISTRHTNANDVFFYRGHSNANYILRPSIMRSEKLYHNECKLYNELQIACPNDFENCHTHLEKLVKMQHYGLPTRLLDITRNLLVALYFACKDQNDSYGEIILISTNYQNIKYPQSDTVSLLASLPAFSYDEQKRFLNLAEDDHTDNPTFNRMISRLIHEVQLEKPSFSPEVNKTDILNNYVVFALKNNNRIIKQDGAFILCGLSAETGSLEDYRYKQNGKKVVVLINNKDSIINELDSFSVNHSTLFPEIESVAQFLKNKYSN